MAARGIYELFSQDQIWLDAQGNRHDIAEMSVRYKSNVIGYLERRAKTLSLVYALGQIEAIYGPIGRESLGVIDGMEVLGEVVYGGPRGQASQDAVEQFLAEDDERREQDPVGFLRDTKLMQRLIADVDAGLGGVDD